MQRLRHKLNFWSIRFPHKEKLLFKQPHELRSLPPQQLRHQLAYLEPTHSGVRDFVNGIFRWRRDWDKQFCLGGGTATLQDAVRELLFTKYREPSLIAYNFDALDDTEDLLRSIVWRMMVDSEVLLVLLWVDSDAVSHRPRRRASLNPGGQVPQFYVPNEYKKTAGHYEVRLPELRYDVPPEVLKVARADTVNCEWPLPAVARKGISPVDRVSNLHLRQDELMDMALAISRAQVVTDDLSLRTERARWKPLREVNEELADTELEISAELHRLQIMKRQATTYYGTYHALSNALESAAVREYVVERFNTLLRRIGERIEPSSEPTKIELVDYPSVEHIREVIENFTRRETSGEDAVKQCTAPLEL